MESSRQIQLAAEYKAVNCFKFFMMNNQSINSSTVSDACSGGSTEIIEMVDHIAHFPSYSIDSVIRHHNNEAFDYLRSRAGMNISFVAAFRYSNFIVAQKGISELNHINEFESDDSNLLLGPTVSDNLYFFKKFLENGAEIKQINYINKAAIHSSFDIVKYLVDNGIYQVDSITLPDKWSPLHYAANSGSYEVIKFLVEKGADINRKDSDGNTPLHLACRSLGDKESILYMLDHGVNPKLKNNEGQTPYMKIETDGDIGCEILEAFISRKAATIETKNEFGLTPLVRAAQSGNLKLAKFCISHGADVDARDPTDQRTALILAAYKNDVPMIELLLDYLADIEAKDEYGNTAFLEAVEFDCPDAIYCLHKHNCKTNLITPDNYTPMMIAAKYGALKSLEALVKIGCDINWQRPNDIFTALEMAVNVGNLDTINKLIDLGANIERYGKVLVSILHSAVYRQNIDVIKLLVKRGANIEDKCRKDGATPLYDAYQFDRIVSFVYMLSIGANPNAKNKNGVSILFGICDDEQVEFLKVLVRYKVNVNEISQPEGANALAPCIHRENPEMVKILCQAGINVNHKDPLGNCPLLYAVQYGNAKIAKILMEYGAHPDMPNNYHMTPMFLAKQYSKTDLINIMERTKQKYRK